MLKNTLLVALRNFRRRPIVTGINVAGLAVGIASCLLIALYVYDEWSYDRHFEDAHRVVRVTTVFGDRPVDDGIVVVDNSSVEIHDLVVQDREGCWIFFRPVVAYTFVGALAVLKITDLISPLRVDAKEKTLGSDFSQHGENLYPVDYSTFPAK